MEHRLRVTLVDGRSLSGTFLALNNRLNLVLVDSDSIVKERTEKRSMYLVIRRGENVVSIAVEGPPAPSSIQ